MAFNIAEHKSTRLNRLAQGQRVTLCDFTKKRAILIATVVGWFIGDKATQAPTSMKEMPANIAMRFANVTNTEGEHVADSLYLVSAPGTYGALFIANTEGEGEAAKTTYRRVTAYAAIADIDAKAAVKAKAKAEAEAAKAAQATPSVDVVAPDVQEPEAQAEAKPKRGKGKAKAEAAPEEITEV